MGWPMWVFFFHRLFWESSHDCSNGFFGRFFFRLFPSTGFAGFFTLFLFFISVFLFCIFYFYQIHVIFTNSWTFFQSFVNFFKIRELFKLWFFSNLVNFFFKFMNYFLFLQTFTKSWNFLKNCEIFSMLWTFLPNFLNFFQICWTFFHFFELFSLFETVNTVVNLTGQRSQVHQLIDLKQNAVGPAHMPLRVSASYLSWRQLGALVKEGVVARN